MRSERTRNLDIPRFDASHRPGMTKKETKLGGIRVTDTYRFRGGGRRLRRLRGGGPALRGSQDLGGGAGRRRQERQLGGDHAVRAGADGAGQDQQLGVRHGAAEGPQRPHRLSAARQGARRLLRDQRHGLYPRPPQRLRSMGLARQSRLVVRRRAALFQALGGQRRFRRRVSRQGRAAGRQQIAHRQSGAGDLPAGRARGPVPDPRGLQCRGA